MKKFILMALSLSFLVYVLARILHLVPKATLALKSKNLVSKQSRGISRILAANSRLQISTLPHLAEK